jgi:uncharacterized membrane-anchored protein
MNFTHHTLATMEPSSTSTKVIKTTSNDNDEECGTSSNDDVKETTSIVEEIILKIPPLTVIYWCEKMTATTFGETFADYWTQTMGLGYTDTSLVLFSIFLVFLGCQIYVKTYWPVIFWAVMSTSSIAGTCVSDFIDRTLQWGYPLGMGVLLSILLVILGIWKLTGLHMNVEGAMNRKQETFYWATILVSNTLGTALGDFVADSLELGFGATAGIFGGLLIICAVLAYFTTVSHVVLFWIAFVLTRPFGATFGDLLTKSEAKGGLNLGTLNASMVIFALFLVAFAIEMYNLHKANKRKEAEAAELSDEIVVQVPVSSNSDHEHKA